MSSKASKSGSKSKDKDSKSKKSDSKSKDKSVKESGSKSKSGSASKDKEAKSSRSKSKSGTDKEESKSKKSSKRDESPIDGKSVKSSKSKAKSVKTEVPEDITDIEKKSNLGSAVVGSPPPQNEGNQALGGAPSMGNFATADAGMGGGSGLGQLSNKGGPLGAYQNQHVTKSAACMLHNKALRYFCESCEELLCYDCTVMGPHNTQLHRISSIDEASRYRLDKTEKAIHQSLVPKRTQLVGQIVRLDHRLDEIKSVSKVIERGIRNEYAAVMERLRSAEGVKCAVLQHDIAEIQKEISRIDEILMFMEEIEGTSETQKDPDSIGFLHGYRQLEENIEYAVTKQFKVEMDVYPNDLPRELAEREVLLEHYEEQRRLLKVKDDMVFRLSQELKKKYDFYQEEFDKETRHEMNEWARLVDRYASELKRYELVCAFCGQYLSGETVNTECADNSHGHGAGDSQDESALQKSNLYFTDEEPESEAHGKRKHWFGRPTMRGQRNQDQVQGFGGPQMTQQVTKADEILLQNPHLLPVMREIYQESLNSQLTNEMIKTFQKYDSQNSRHCAKEDFINTVFGVVKSIKPADLMKFMLGFTATYEEGHEINYDEFIQAIDHYGSQFNEQQNMPQYASNPATPSGMNKMASNYSSDKGVNKNLIEKVKQQVQQASGGLTGIDQNLRKLGGRGGEMVSQEEMLLAFNRSNAMLGLDEIKEFFNHVAGVSGSKNDFVKIKDLMREIQ